MKVKAFMRVGYDKGRRTTYIDASRKPNTRPLSNTLGDVPTVAFAIAFDIPDEAFAQAEQVIAEIRIPREALQIAAEVIEPAEVS